jgi:hypothetical protein
VVEVMMVVLGEPDPEPGVELVPGPELGGAPVLVPDPELGLCVKLTDTTGDEMPMPQPDPDFLAFVVVEVPLPELEVVPRRTPAKRLSLFICVS